MVQTSIDLFDKTVQSLENKLNVFKHIKEAGDTFLAQGVVTSVDVKTREEFFEVPGKYGEPEDILVRISFEVFHEGELFDADSVIYTVSSHRRSHLGKYVMTYGTPKKGQQIQVQYNSDKERWTVLS